MALKAKLRALGGNAESVRNGHRIFECRKGPINLVLIDATISLTLGQYAQTTDTSMSESGGILLGFRKEDNHLEVCSATEPTTTDQQSRYEFTRNRGVHQSRARQLWLRSRGYIDYIGEWHTHPESIPSPSFVDIRSWKKISQRVGRPMIGLIIGTEEWSLSLVSGNSLSLTKEHWAPSFI